MSDLRYLGWLLLGHIAITCALASLRVQIACRKVATLACERIGR